jgi:hypothetical protein
MEAPAASRSVLIVAEQFVDVRGEVPQQRGEALQ